MGRVVSVAVGDRPGLVKRPVDVGWLVADHGLEGDRHAGPGPRQLSLLDQAVVDALHAQGIRVEPGLLGENLTLSGVALDELRPGARLRVGTALIEITEIRQPCRSVLQVDSRALRALIGRAGQMARVVGSGEVRRGDPVERIEGVYV
ncbi:MAG TPA: MOSC domain-containing protein [Chloroflexota bacterium]|nr:MOSC domain-containing protein [Chloroflexota bacterium]